MKKLFISALLATAMFVACTNPENPAPAGTGTVPPGSVSFNLGMPSSTGTAELFDNESKISNVTVAVFRKGGSLHAILSPKLEGGNYSFDLEGGNWEMWVVANAQSPEALSESLTIGESRESDLLRLSVDGTLSENRKVPMLSTECVDFYHDTEKSTLLGQIEMTRLAARIDVVNAVDELTITRIVMHSRAKAGTLGNQTTTENASLEDKAFNNLAIEGDSRMPAVFSGSLYSYDNNGAGGNAPSVVVYYSYLGEEYSKEFGFDAGVVRNNLYSIQFVYAGEELDYKAESWGNGSRMVALFSAFELPNRDLAAWRFARNNVKTLNAQTGAVTFCTGQSDSPYTTAWSTNFADNIYTDAAGNNYRVPTLDEMRLLVPNATRFITSVIELDPVLGDPVVKKDLNVEEVLPDLFGESGSGGGGTSDFWNVPDETTRMATTYAIRFKNTLQVAAYRYKMEGSSWTVRIKALGMTVPAEEVVCDEAYWQDGYFEFVFTEGRYWTSTPDTTAADRARYLYVTNYLDLASINMTTSNVNLRLVCVD